MISKEQLIPIAKAMIVSLRTSLSALAAEPVEPGLTRQLGQPFTDIQSP